MRMIQQVEVSSSTRCLFLFFFSFHIFILVYLKFWHCLHAKGQWPSLTLWLWVTSVLFAEWLYLKPCYKTSEDMEILCRSHCWAFVSVAELPDRWRESKSTSAKRGQRTKPIFSSLLLFIHSFICSEKSRYKNIWDEWFCALKNWTGYFKPLWCQYLNKFFFD